MASARNFEIVIGNTGSDCVVLGPKSSSRVEVSVDCDGWSGTTQAWFFKGDFSRFAQQIREIHRTLSGAAKLEPVEPNIALTLTGDGKGHVNVKGTAQRHFERKNRLTFEFSIDQTYLKAIADLLDEADPMLDQFH
jgi:hypothetical protein